MPTLDRLTGSADRVFVDSLKASAANSLAVPRPLFQALQAAGIRAPNDVDRLDAQQLARLLENKTPSERMALKTQVMAARLYPRDASPFSVVR